MMILASSSFQPPCRLSSARTISVAKPRRSPHGFTSAASNPRASCCSVRARMAVPRRAEHVQDLIDDPEYVLPSDTTLHDGEQSPEAIMTSNDTLLLADQRARPGVVTIEAGLSAYSPEDPDAVRSSAMEAANTPLGIGEDGDMLVLCGLSGCNQRDIDVACEAQNPDIDTILDTSKVLTLPVKPEQVVDHGYTQLLFLQKGTALNIIGTGYTLHVKLIADINANTPGIDHGFFVGPFQLEVTVNGSGERARNASLDEVQEQSGLHVQTHKATVGANVIAHESENGIHKDLNGMSKLKGTSETSSGDVGSTHENEFDNGKLSGSYTVGTKLVELGYDKEIKDPCKCVNEDAEEKKPPVSRVREIIEFLDLVKAVIGVGWVIIPIVHQSHECLPFMWQMAVMAQPCLRVIAFFGLGTMLALGLAMMWYGMKVFLKVKSTSHSA